MAYQFQSWGVNQVLTSVMTSQIEVNVRDHKHGEAGVAKIQNRTPNPVSDVFVKDEFIGGITNGGTLATGMVGEMGWFVAATNSTLGQIYADYYEQGHPGIIKIETHSAINYYHAIYTVAHSVHPTNTFDVTFIFGISSTVNIDMRIGLSYQPYGGFVANPTDGIYIEKLAADTKFFGVARASSVETRVDTLITVASGTWYRIRLRRIDASTIGYTINDGTEYTITTNIPTNGQGLWAYVNNTGSSVKAILIDYCDLAISGLTR